MSDIINILPDSVANQIAAGEVVDRPASAVKELIENAMDAGANQIQLIVKDAGRTLIQVIDNGSGMSESDARLCFERHATSKIHKADDLFDIHTMGFRGEALASIAAIAQVELKTKLPNVELGTCVEIEGSIIKNQTHCSCANGTSISVKNLFFNVPARRNFLKKDSVELSHIEEIFKRIVITHCDIAFSFHHNGRILYDLKAGNLAQRIAQTYGDAYRGRFYPVEEQTEVVGIKGYVSKPEYAKKTRGEQYIFVNGRYIKHMALCAAVEKAYTELVPDHYYPSYFLSLEVNPSRIDVNIHPTKTEVKFIDEHAIFAFLRAATKKALGQFSLANEIEFNPSTEIDFTPAPKDYTPKPPQIQYNENYNPFGNTQQSPTINTVHGTTPSHAANTHNYEAPTHYNDNRWENFFKTNDEAATQPQQEQLFDTHNIKTQLASCLQVQNRWIISTISSGMILIDQQQAHERIIYERLMARKAIPHAQQMLFPVNCSFSAADAEIFTEMLPDIIEQGFEINTLGRNTFVVTATPPDVKESELQQLFDQMISEYKGALMQKFADRNQCLCRTLARQMATKSGQTLAQEEMQQIVADLFSCQVPEVSPSGKKTLHILSESDINKLFTGD